MRNNEPGGECSICHRHFPKNRLTPAPLIRESIASLIRDSHPEWDSSAFICRDDLARFRSDYVRTLLEAESGELSQLDSEVVKSMQNHELLAANPVVVYEKRESLGERIADKVASFGGSWNFIILFGVILAVWMTFNALTQQPFDPYPFILLNLVLSTIAALQAPVIMMSQNRQETKDRLRSEGDYQVNVKAELEIRHLHEKVDHLLSSQWQRLTEIQQVQIELLHDMASKKD